MNDTFMLCLAMLAGGLITFATRAIFLMSGERFSPGPRFRALLAYVPAAVLAALIAPEVLVQQGKLLPVAENPRLWAAALAVVVAFFSRSVLATIGVGLAALWVFRMLMS